MIGGNPVIVSAALACARKPAGPGPCAGDFAGGSAFEDAQSVDLIGYALWFAQLGMAVLPLHRPVTRDGNRPCSCGRNDCTSVGKHPYAPLAPKGVNSASADPDTIRRWFSDGDGELNLGIATGSRSGIVVVDIDPRHDGDEALADLERQHGELPRTWRFLTGGGGQHIVFRHPGGSIPNTAGAVGKGIDVRGEGGFIVVPPSFHASGRRYAISVDHYPDETDLADVPEWLLKLLRAPAEKRRPVAKTPEHWRQVACSRVSEGARNNTLTSFAGHLLRNRIDGRIALELLQSWNMARCCPPLPEAEVERIVRSIAAREVLRRQGNGPDREVCDA